jgi:hypothetical protein
MLLKLNLAKSYENVHKKICTILPQVESELRDDESSYPTSTVVTYTCNEGYKFLAKVRGQFL